MKYKLLNLSFSKDMFVCEFVLDRGPKANVVYVRSHIYLVKLVFSNPNFIGNAIIVNSKHKTYLLLT